MVTVNSCGPLLRVRPARYIGTNISSEPSMARAITQTLVGALCAGYGVGLGYIYVCDDSFCNIDSQGAIRSVVIHHLTYAFIVIH